MLKLLGSLLVVVSLSACYSTAPHLVAAEPADPIVGDLHCARPQLSILEALYFVPDASTPVVAKRANRDAFAVSAHPPSKPDPSQPLDRVQTAVGR